MGVHSSFLLKKKNWKQIKRMPVGDWLNNFHIHSCIHNKECDTAITQYYLYVKIPIVNEKCKL